MRSEPIICGLLLLLCGVIIGWSCGRNSYEKEAVLRGCAEWTANERGEAEWQWICGGEPKE